MDEVSVPHRNPYVAEAPVPREPDGESQCGGSVGDTGDIIA